MKEIPADGTTVGVVLIFALLVIREVLAWLKVARDHKQPQQPPNPEAAPLTAREFREAREEVRRTAEHLSHNIERLKDKVDANNQTRAPGS